ncbi:hypothetical protein FOL46_004108, partial [Perkinsus olseni]
IDQVKSFKSAFQEDGPASNIEVENIETRAGIESVKNRKAGEELHSRLPVQYTANGLPTVAVRLQDQVTSVALLDTGATDVFVSAYIVNSSRWEVVLPKWVLESCAWVKPETSDSSDYLLFSGDETTPHGGGPETGDVAVHTAERSELPSTRRVRPGVVKIPWIDDRRPKQNYDALRARDLKIDRKDLRRWRDTVKAMSTSGPGVLTRGKKRVLEQMEEVSKAPRKKL